MDLQVIESSIALFYKHDSDYFTIFSIYFKIFTMKRFITVIITVVLLVQVLSLVTGISLVIPITKSNCHSNGRELKKDDCFNVFDKMDFEKGNWKAYLIIAPEDFKYLNNDIPKATCFSTSDKEVLKNMQKQWKFRYTKGEISDVNSKILIYQNNKLVFKSGIVLDNYHEGLQCQTFGWLQPIDPFALSKACKQFERIYWPIVVI